MKKIAALFGFGLLASTMFGIPVAHWRYDLAAADGGCRVTERMWDRRPGWFVKPGGVATGVTDRPTVNVKHIKLTLQRLKEKAEAR